MSEHKPESKKNPLIAYFQDSYEELKKVTWPTRNQAIRLTFIVIGFCVVVSLFVGVLDLAFNTGYIAIVNYSEKVNPQAPTTPVATGEPTSNVDLSKIKVDPAPAPGANGAAGDVKLTDPVVTPVPVTDSTQQTK